MLFPIKCQGDNITVIYGKLRQEELQYICIVRLLIMLDLLNMHALMNVLHLPSLYSRPLMHTILNFTQNILPD